MCDDTPDQIDSTKVVERLIGLYGGRTAAFEALDRSFREASLRWDQDTQTMGRILRSHLFVEHYLTQYLQAHSPNLADLDEARLSFAQKLALVDRTDRSVEFLIGGIRRLNTVRNRLAHTLRAEVSSEDRRAFLSIGLFRAMRSAGAHPANPSNDPIVVLEDFAKFAGSMLESAASPESKLWAVAVRETTAEDNPAVGP